MVQTQKEAPAKHDGQACGEFILPIRDTLDILSGKWKIQIIGALMFGKKRFKEIERQIPNLTARMLSKELKELETNQLITRTVYATIPVTVEYEITEYGKTLNNVLMAMKEWGTIHRRRIMAKRTSFAL